MMQRKSSFSNTAILAVVLVFGFASHVYAVDCKINVLEAYTYAKKKGWSFACSKKNNLESVVFLPLPPDSIGCVGKTNTMLWNSAGIFEARFFVHASISDVTGKTKWRKLNNGWIAKDYDVFGGEHTRYFDLKKALAKFRGNIPVSAGTSRKFKFVVKNIIVSKDNGKCSDALREAF